MPSYLGSYDPTLTFLCAQSKAIIDLLEHGLTALFEGWQHHTLKGFSVGSLHRPL
jgi:hypothetical protein